MVAISFTEPEKEGQVQEEQPVQGQIQGEAPLTVGNIVPMADGIARQV